MKLLQLPCGTYVNPEHVASVEADSVFEAYVGPMGTPMWGVRIRLGSEHPIWIPCESETAAISDEFALRLSQ